MRSKRAAEVRTFAVDFSAKLHNVFDPEVEDELLSGTPTVVEIGSSALTISGIGVTSDEWILDGQSVPKEQAVEFTVAGGVAGTIYTLRITATTDADTPQTLIADIELRVN